MRIGHRVPETQLAHSDKESSAQVIPVKLMLFSSGAYIHKCRTFADFRSRCATPCLCKKAMPLLMPRRMATQVFSEMATDFRLP
jgi:hypothetical protein|eukprot:COSAG01_NODE_864_length_13055_cov_18.442498_9_plen_84_part_00